MRKFLLRSSLILVLLGSYSVAQAGEVAVGVKAGTLGLGLEATTNIVPLFANVRLQGNVFNYNTTITDTNVTYDTKLKLASVGVLADFYPFAGKFRITGGLYYNGNKLDMNAQAKGAVVIGATTYTSPTVNTTVTFNTFAPYAGIGWGDAISSGSPLGFNMDIGVLYQGTPKTSIVAPAVSAADIAAEKRKLDNSLNKMKFYPVVSLGMSYKF
jgi:hypothetical protein